MEAATLVTIAVVGAALLGILFLPMRKRWNDDGAADAARRQAVARDLEPVRLPRDLMPADLQRDEAEHRELDPPRGDAAHREHVGRVTQDADHPATEHDARGLREHADRRTLEDHDPGDRTARHRDGHAEDP